MNIKVACPHCQVVGVVQELKYASDWPVGVITAINTTMCLLWPHQHPYPDKSSCVVQIVGARLHLIKTSTNQLLKAIFHCFARIAMLTF